MNPRKRRYFKIKAREDPTVAATPVEESVVEEPAVEAPVTKKAPRAKTIKPSKKKAKSE